MDRIFLIKMVVLLLIVVGIIRMYKSEFWKKYSKIVCKTKIRRVIYLTLLMTVLLFIAFFPVSKLLKFKSIEKAVDTLYPDYDIIYQQVANDTALVFIESYNKFDSITFVKDNGKWSYNDSSRFVSYADSYSAYANEIKKKDITYIQVYYPTSKDEKNNVNIKDSLSSEFRKINVKGKTWYLTTITKELDKDNYKMYINDEEVTTPFVGWLEFLLKDDN